MFVIYAVLLLDIHKDIRVKIRNQPQKENFLGLLTTGVNTATIQVSLTNGGIMLDYLWVSLVCLLFLGLGLVIKNWKGK